jgi:hypothetical protein
MSRRVILRAAVAGVAVSAATGLVLLVVLGGNSTPRSWAGSTLTGPTAAGSPTRPSGPGPAAAAPAAGPSAMVSSRPGAASGGPPPTPTGGPQPHVQPYAQDPVGQVHPSMASPTAPVTEPIGLDGCDHDYGTVNQCVPLTYPPGVASRCAWLLAHGFGPMKVVGMDRENLDTDHNGVACDPGDA